jgi:RNA polymerase sigma-70 factor (ECF subfamily)
VLLSETGAHPLRDKPWTVQAVERLIALDQDAWHDLFEQYFQRMYSFAYVRTGDPHLAEEIASEVFAAAAHSIQRYKPTGAPIAAWLYRIARNITADHWDRKRRRPQTSIEGMELEAASWLPGVERNADLRRALAGLSREQQELIALRFFNDCTLEETARALGKSVGAVKVAQHRALAALRSQLGDGGR